MAPHSSILAWRILWMQEPGKLLSIGSHRVRHDWGNLACMHALEKEMTTHSSVLAWRIPGMGEPGGLPSMGSHGVGHDWSNLAAAAVLSLGCPRNWGPFCKFRCRWQAVVSTSWLLLSQHKLEDASWLGKCERLGSSITDPKDMSLSKLQEIVKDRGTWHAAIHGSQRVRHNWGWWAS